MEQAAVRLKKGEGRSFKAGGPWIYGNEIDLLTGPWENGGLVRIEDYNGYVLGHGFVNTNSAITVRALSRRADAVIDEAFLDRRVRAAWQYRKDTVDTACCRLIFGEADAFPGLTVDRFETLLVTQTLSLGMEKIKDMLFPLIVEVLEEDGEKIEAFSSATMCCFAKRRA